MSKWKCSVCGYIYDSEKGIPEKALKQVQNLKIYLMTLNAQDVVPAKLCLNSYRFGQKN